MFINFLIRFAVPIIGVLLFFLAVYIIVYILHSRSRKLRDEDPIITALEENNVDSFLKAIGRNESDAGEYEKEKDEIVVSPESSRAEEPEDPPGGIKTAINSFLGNLGMVDQEDQGDQG